MILTVLSLLLISLLKKPGYVLCYIVLFTSLNSLLLNQLNAISIRFLIGILFTVLFLAIYLKPRLLKKRIKVLFFKNKLFWGVLLIPILMLFHIFVLNDISYDGIKYSNHFITSTILYFFFVVLLIQDNSLFNQFINSIVIWGFIYYLSVYLFVDLSVIDTDNRMSLVETEQFNPITLGRFSGILFITGLAQIMNSDKKVYKYLSFFIVGISLYWILIASTRQIVIGILFAYCIYYLFKIGTDKKIPYYILGATAILIVFLSFIDLSQFSLVERIYDLKNIESMQRYNDYLVTYSIFKDNLVFGLGPHGYQDLMGGRYPHSYFLEMVASFGILGLSAFAVVTISGFYYSIYIINYNRINYRFDIVALLWLFYFVSVMLSGDLNINREFWIITGILIVAIIIFKKSKRENLRIYN